MIKDFEQLNKEERELLYRAPVLVSALVSCNYNDVNETKKNDAIKLAHLRAFAAPTLLLPYYQQVEKIFKEEFERTVKKYFPFDDEKRAKLNSEIGKVDRVIAKLDTDYANALNNSLESYAKHVKRSGYSVFQDFIFPLTYSKLKDL